MCAGLNIALPIFHLSICRHFLAHIYYVSFDDMFLGGYDRMRYGDEENIMTETCRGDALLVYDTKAGLVKPCETDALLPLRHTRIPDHFLSPDEPAEESRSDLIYDIFFVSAVSLYTFVNSLNDRNSESSPSGI